jgi:hypothetical protein
LIAGTARAEEAKKDPAADAEKKNEPKKDDKKKDDKKKDDKKDKKDETLVSYPEPVAKAWLDRYGNAELPVARETDKGIEFTTHDQWNEKIKVLYSRDGKLIEESERKLPLAKAPVKVVDTAKKWAPAATWNETVIVETKDSQVPVYQVKGDLSGKSIEAKIREDGTVAKADKIESEKKDDHKKDEHKSDGKKEEKK